MTILTLRVSEEEVLASYIFDIFSKYKDVIQKDQLLQVIETFSDLPEETI